MTNHAPPLSNTFSDLSRLAFGCMGLGGSWEANSISQADIRFANAAIDAALEANINFFDHADIYSRGKAEKVFGEVLKQRPELRDKIYLQSKCGIRFGDEHTVTRYDFSPQWILQSVEDSLKRLSTDYLDLYLLHRPDPLMEPEAVAETFNLLQESGKVRHFGVSNMNGVQIEFLQSYLSQPLLVNQIDINLNQLDWLEQGILVGNPEGKNTNFTAGTLEYCKKHKVQIQSWGSLCQGLFSGRDLSQASQAQKDTAQKVSALAEFYDSTAESIVLAWLMRHPNGIQPVIGTANPERILACKDAPNVQLSREHWYELYVTSRGKTVP